MRRVVAIVDSGALGLTPLDTHVVICGFPRSGSTLLSLMLRVSAPEARSFDNEHLALEVARWALRSHASMVTKRPSDVHRIEQIRSFYSSRNAQARFVLTLRDPRSVLTSRYAEREDYYVSVDRWRAIYESWPKTAESDILIVRYEDLVSAPDDVQKSLEHHTGLRIETRLADFHRHVPRGFTTEALNGVRPLEPLNTERWRDAEHIDRLRALLEHQMPELPQRLIQLGYESDSTWTEGYLAQQP